MNIAEYLRKNTRLYPNRTAVWHGEKPALNYAALLQQVCGLAGFLKEKQKLKPGDRVMIVMQNAPEFIPVFWAALWTGTTVVPLNAKLHAREIAALVESCSPAVVFDNAGTESNVKKALRQLVHQPVSRLSADALDTLCCNVEPVPQPAERSPQDTAWLFYTSGTTGTPKGALLSHRNLTLMAEAFIEEVLPLSPDDLLLHAAPMSHGSGMYMVPYMLAGAGQVIPESGKFKEQEIIDLCANKERIAFFAAPTMVQRLLREAANGKNLAKLRSGLRCIIYGGGPMHVDSARKAHKALPGRLAQIYGQGECPMTISRLPSSDFDESAQQFEQRLASVGQAFAGVEIRIDSSDKDSPGEILVRSALVMSGYLDNPEATAQTIQDDWLHTGDVGYLDEHGYLHLCDRIKDMIISGGSNIYPREVEDVLIEHDSVYEVAVVGRPSEEWGEDVIAHLSLNTGHTMDNQALDDYCKANLARFKRPKAYILWDSLPKNAYGKIDKKLLS